VTYRSPAALATAQRVEKPRTRYLPYSVDQDLEGARKKIKRHDRIRDSWAPRPRRAFKLYQEADLSFHAPSDSSVSDPEDQQKKESSPVGKSCGLVSQQ
jgi:hypothetical protein